MKSPTYAFFGEAATLAVSVLLFAFAASSPRIASAQSPSKLTTFMTDAGWCWYQDPRAVISNDKLVVGGVSGQTGDIKVSVFDLKANKLLGTKTLHAQFESDDHNVPAFYVRPDGSLLAVWAKHGNEKIHHYCISSPDDYLQWGQRQAFKHDYPDRPGVTYQNLLVIENEGLLFNFFRDGKTYNPTFITSDDDGNTWQNRTHFIADEVDGRHRPYPRYLQRDANTIGVSFTEGHPRNYGNSLYYADFREGAFFKADGTKIKNLDDGPLMPSEAERIYQGSDTTEKPDGFGSVPNSAWTCATATDAMGHPKLGYTLYLSNDDHRFRMASFDGTGWIDREIAYAGTCLYPRETSYTGLMTFDPEDSSKVFVSSDVDPTTGAHSEGKHQIYCATITPTDDISSIKWQPIQHDSGIRNIRPMALSADGYKVLLWLKGPWNTYTDYATNVVGIVLERPR
ncbi:BNR-4 repeat-containing protein [Stieleria marina]|uniref:BNR-4 repeat-containing protein n=1 Tax=Stieleria marina TaxID=1930275 RepID=UPI003AF3804C